MSYKKILSFLQPRYIIFDTSRISDKKEKMPMINFGTFDNNQAITLNLFRAKIEHPLHIHDETGATFYFISGKGKLLIGINDDLQEIEIKPGLTFTTDAGVAHGFIIEEDTLMISIQDNGGIKKDGGFDFRYI